MRGFAARDHPLRSAGLGDRVSTLTRQSLTKPHDANRAVFPSQICLEIPG
jgi:hypothetical protein